MPRELEDPSKSLDQDILLEHGLGKDWSLVWVQE